jgi:hypothetical protein
MILRVFFLALLQIVADGGHTLPESLMALEEMSK